MGKQKSGWHWPRIFHALSPIVFYVVMHYLPHSSMSALEYFPFYMSISFFFWSLWFMVLKTL